MGRASREIYKSENGKRKTENGKRKSMVRFARDYKEAEVAKGAKEWEDQNFSFKKATFNHY